MQSSGPAPVHVQGGGGQRPVGVQGGGAQRPVLDVQSGGAQRPMGAQGGGAPPLPKLGPPPPDQLATTEVTEAFLKGLLADEEARAALRNILTPAEVDAIGRPPQEGGANPGCPRVRPSPQAAAPYPSPSPSPSPSPNPNPTNPTNPNPNPRCPTLGQPRHTRDQLAHRCDRCEHRWLLVWRRRLMWGWSRG